MAFLLLSCGPQYIDDPNSHTLVTSQYENGPIEIVRTSNCKPMVDCTSMSDADCAIAHYEAASQFINDAQKLISKRLYTSAQLEYMQALCRLEVAKILLNQAKLNNFEEYKRVTDSDLENRIAQRISLCDRKIDYLRWK